MQTQDSFTVTRRPFDIEDYVDILRRNKSWIIGPLYAGLVIATVVAFLWPDTYVSTSLVRVTPAQVPERIVPSALNQILQVRINGIAQGVLSRTTLVNIIQTHELYERERRRLPLEDIVDRMRNKDISIGGVSTLQGQSASAGAFPISFRYENRYKAQKVTQEIVSRLITENTRVQQDVSRGTTEFLSDEVGKSRKRLDEIESNLTKFRIKNSGRLPDERSMNFTALQTLESRIGTINNAISRINQEKLLLESQLRIQKDQHSQAIAHVSSLGDVNKARVQNEKLTALEREVSATENSLAQLREMYREVHPDVQRVKSNLQQIRRQRDALLESEKESDKAAQAAASKATAKDISNNKEIQELYVSIKQLEGMIHAKTQEAQDYSRELSKLTVQIRDYQGRIGATPVADQEYATLTRDYETAKLEYQELMVKQGEAKRGQEIERRNQGETLELLDDASLPIEPTEPKRPIIIGAGAFLGLVLGVGLVGIREMRDTTLKNLKDVRTYTQLTVLGSVPLLEEDLVVKRRKRLALLGWSTAVIIGALVMGGSFYYYIATKP